MNRKLTEVKETAEQLRAKLKSEENPLLRQLLQALYLIASKQVKRRTPLANILGVNRNSVSMWLIIYEAGGLEGLLKLKKAKGQPPKMTREAKVALAD